VIENRRRAGAERFVRNMLAGEGGRHGDPGVRWHEGVMPQTARETIASCQILRHQVPVVVLSKPI